MATPDAPVAISIPQAAKRLNIGLRAAYRAAADGTLPTLRFGKRIVVPVSALEAWARDAYQPNPNSTGREDAAR